MIDRQNLTLKAKQYIGLCSTANKGRPDAEDRLAGFGYLALIAVVGDQRLGQGFRQLGIQFGRPRTRFILGQLFLEELILQAIDLHFVGLQNRVDNFVPPSTSAAHLSSLFIAPAVVSKRLIVASTTRHT